MNPTKWEKVLVQWINCLQLLKPINTLEELRDGQFLRRLCKHFKQTIDLIPDDDLTVIFELLVQHYPQIKFNEMDSVHISDLLSSELVYLTSLLMHYTSVYDRRVAFTEPMCTMLDSNSQMMIKEFLEKISCETTTEELEGIIKEICTEDSKSLTCQFLPLINTPINKKSPLQKFFSTPFSKTLKFQEKDRQIDKLRRELEIEKAERTECEVENKNLVEKNKKLEFQLKQKNAELKRLCSEMESLDVGEPPKSHDTTWNETQRLLKLELQSLEEYIVHCDKEGEELRRERDELREKNKTLEESCQMWREKYLELDEKFESTYEDFCDLKCKKDLLYSKCNELENMLDEFKSKSVSSFDESIPLKRRSGGFDLSQSVQDLGHTVIDLQLREVQTKLEKTENELKVALEQNQSLLEDITVCTNSKKKVEAELETLKQEQGVLKANLTAQINTLKSEKSYLDTKLTELAKALDTEKQKLNNVSGAKDTLELELTNTKNQLQGVMFEKTEMDKKYSSTFEKWNDTIKRLEETEEVLKSTALQLSKVSSNKEDLDKQYNKISEELTVSLKSLKETQDNLKFTELQLQKITFHKENLEKQSENISEELNTVSKKLEQTLCFWKATESQLQELTFINQNLEIEHRKTSEQLVATLQELQDASNILKITEQQLHEMTSVKEKFEKQYSEISIQLNSTLKKHEDSEEALLRVKEQLSKISLENDFLLEQHRQTSENLAKSLQQLQESEDLLQAFEQQLQELTSSKNDLEEKNNEISRELISTSNKLHETECFLKSIELQLSEATSKKDDVEQQFTNISEELAYTLKRLQETENSLENVNLQLYEVNLTKNRLEEQYKCTSQDLNDTLKKHQCAEDAVKKSEFKLKKELLNKDNLLEQQRKMSEELAATLSQLQATETKLNMANLQLHDMTSSKEHLDLQYNNTCDELSTALKMLNETKDTLKYMENALREVTSEKTNLKKTFADMCVCLDDAYSELKELKLYNASVAEELKKALLDKAAMEEELKCTQQALEDMTVALKDTITVKQETTETLNLVQTELNKKLEELENIEKESNLLKKEHQQLKKKEFELSKNLEESQYILDKTRGELNVIKLEKDKLKFDFEDVKLKLLDMTKSERKYKENLSKKETELIIALQDLDDVKQNLSKTHEQLSQSKASFRTVSNDLCVTLEAKEVLEKKHLDIVDLLAESTHESNRNEQLLQKKSQENDFLKKQVNEWAAKCETTSTILSESQKELSIATEDLQETLLRKRRFVHDLEILQEDYKALKQYTESKTDENFKLSQNLQKAQLKISDLQTALNSLMENHEKLTDEYANVRDDHRIKCEALEEASKQLENVKEELRLTREEKTMYFKKFELGIQKLQVTEDRFDKMVAENDKLKISLERQIDELLTNVQSVEEERRILKASLNETLAKLGHTESKCQDIANELQSAQEEKTVVSNFLDLNTNELRKVSQQKEQILEALEMSNKDKLELEREIKKLKLIESERNLLVEQNLAIETACTDWQKKYSEVCEDVARRIQEFGLEKKELQQLLKKNSVLSEIQFNELQKKYNDDIKIKSKHIDALQIKMGQRLEEALEKNYNFAAKIKEKLTEIQNKHSKEFEAISDQFKIKKEGICNKVLRVNGQLTDQIKLNNLMDKKSQDIHKQYDFPSPVEVMSNDFETYKLAMFEQLQGVLREKDMEIKNAENSYKMILEELEAQLKKNDCVEAARKKLLEDNSEILESLQKLIKEKEALFNELSELKKENEDLQYGKKDYESEIKKLLSDIGELKERLEDSRKTKEELVAHIQEKQREMADLENKVKRLMLEVEDKTKEKNEIYDQLQRYVEEKAEIEQKLEHVQKENVILIQERDSLYDKLQTSLEENQKILLSRELSQEETQKIKREMNNLLKTQTEIMIETEANLHRAHSAAVEEKKDLIRRTESAENERDKVREAYVAVKASNAKYELENSSLRKMLEERTSQLKQFSQIKEAYDKLLEDNIKYMKEVETLKVKRGKDRDEFVRLIHKEREEGEAKKQKKVKEIRTEYEEKLEKMKDKMVHLYREEVNKEMQKVKAETAELHRTIGDLRGALYEAEEKASRLQKDRDVDSYRSRESVHGLPFERVAPKQGVSSLRGRGNKVADRDSIMSAQSTLSLKEGVSRDQLQRVRSASTLQDPEIVDRLFRNRKMSTLPSRMENAFVEETITVSRRTSINSIGRNLEMEDEDGDMFNNKYLADLKDGRCITSIDRESNVNRMSELAWRNSMVPPHLKSCYPAETQFVSPSKFKENEIKMGAGPEPMDDSMVKLLPGEKPRQKKDFGTTSYKKPGPPTPSKNGGRSSLTGNELPLRDGNNRNSTTPNKKVTPNRIRSLFKGFTKEGFTSRENAENVTPRASRRLSSLFKNNKR
ncbi:uncharacterized protein LOC126736214 isoform X2 [Anthonomus grandis grandis]|nr:uncharacterized protein LOC126736214 isoform X2 [Anthonomus grandis grandis]